MAEKYVPYTWLTKDPITKAKMQHIEDGILNSELYTDEQITPLQTSITTLITNLNKLNSGIGYNETELSAFTVKNRLEQLQRDIAQSGATELTSRLEALEQQVTDARNDGNSNPDMYPSLTEVLQTMRNTTAGVSAKADTAKDAADAANSFLDAAKGRATSIVTRFDDIDTVNTTQNTKITVIEDKLRAPVTGVEKTMVEFLQEIAGAHRTTTDTLDTRFDEIEAALSGVTGDSDTTIKTK